VESRLGSKRTPNVQHITKMGRKAVRNDTTKTTQSVRGRRINMVKLTDILSGGAQPPAEYPQSMRQVLAYARVSTDNQERAGLSIPAQIREMLNYAKTKGISIVETYEEAESAFSDESRRPEFWRMVARAKSDPEITGILVHDFSRFFRDPYAGPMVKGELLAHGVSLSHRTGV